MEWHNWFFRLAGTQQQSRRSGSKAVARQPVLSFAPAGAACGGLACINHSTLPFACLPSPRLPRFATYPPVSRRLPRPAGAIYYIPPASCSELRTELTNQTLTIRNKTQLYLSLYLELIPLPALVQTAIVPVVSLLFSLLSNLELQCQLRL